MKIASNSDKELVVSILCSAFDDNRGINFIVKQDHKRQQRIKYLMDYCFDTCMGKGNIYLNDDESGAALILDSENNKRLLKNVIQDFNLGIYGIGLNNVFRVSSRERQLRRHHPDSPFYYLWFIGVPQKSQNKGIRSAFFHEVIQACDKNKRPVYLETSVSRNLPWYKKYGFQVFKELNIGYKLFLMIRN